jgi:glutaconate CoA-transferase subunit A
MNPVFATLEELIARFVRDRQCVALEGFTHLIPFAAAHELIRQQRRELHLVRMTPDLVYDQLVGAGCAAELTFSWGGNPGVGSLHRLRDALENEWPRPLRIHEHSHAGMAAAYSAGAARLPFGLLRGYEGGGLAEHNPQVRQVRCPYTGERLATVPALRPEVTVLHAQAADRRGNVLIRGIVGAQKEAALAADTLLVTVEQVVERLDAPMNAIVLPHFCVSGIACVPGGAWPSYAQGHYARDNAFYQAWDGIARDRSAFQAWIDTHVLGTRTHADFLHSLDEAA